MWDIERLGRTLCVAAVTALAVAACGSDGEPDSVATEPDVAVTVPDTGDTTESDVGAGSAAGPAGLTIEGLCEPLDEIATGWVSGDVERQHNALFADDEPASLVCEWLRSPDYREIRVVYHASPAVWDATVAAGGVALDAVGVDSVYDGDILAVHADNGWTVDVIAFEGDPPDYADVPDVLVAIANAAVEASR